MATSQKVLVVEDETDIVRTLEYNFRQAGFGVFTATSGSEGLRLAIASARPTRRSIDHPAEATAAADSLASSA